jgi:hypothetical protein
MNCSIALDKLEQWYRLAKPGDVAYHFSDFSTFIYLCVYDSSDMAPVWRMFTDIEEAQKYLDKHFIKKEDTKMNKRCENCKYYNKVPGMQAYCTHDKHMGMYVPGFVSCSEHEFKEELTGPFGNLKFYLKDSNTGEIELKYICEDCGKAMSEPFHWWKVETPKPTKAFGKPGYHWRCEECDKKKDGKI